MLFFILDKNGYYRVAKVRQDLAFKKEWRVQDNILLFLNETYLPQFLQDGKEDVLVSYGVQDLPFHLVRKYNVSKFSPVNWHTLFLLFENTDTKSLNNELVGWLSRLYDLSRQGVTVYHLDLQVIHKEF